MKKLILIAIALVTLQVSAQDKKRDHQKGDKHERKEMLKDFSAEEIATLKTKKMTLHLDLTKAQQKEIHALNLEQAKAKKVKMAEREKKMEGKEMQKPSKDEKLKMMNERLDHQIATKQKMKTILNAEQFEKFEKMQSKRHSQKGKKKHMKAHNKRH
ncbi:hypothetical protein [Ichthyenterobacterium magnum]|uniref:LTXXQ motif family protein n=1 Tax=Ichthyenterobacterium magnum TaxID=1230530 RepID=A0A420DG07_9FLAO|nr:hypothetical protein [Ichthyenterobacterium magnum]RKE91998.1 hypothetical protein BXY80_2430 [Ichthyenterobacterium magnum]